VTTVELDAPPLEFVDLSAAPERPQQTIQNYVSSVGLDHDETERRVRATAAAGWTEEDIQGKIDAFMAAVEGFLARG
jgi:hypothetical protein